MDSFGQKFQKTVKFPRYAHSVVPPAMPAFASLETSRFSEFLSRKATHNFPSQEL